MDRVLIGGIRVFERCCWWWWLGRWWYSSPSSKAVVLEATDPKADAAKTRNFRFIFAPRLVSSPLRQNRCLFHVLRHSSVPCVSGEDSIKIGKKTCWKSYLELCFRTKSRENKNRLCWMVCCIGKKKAKYQRDKCTCSIHKREIPPRREIWIGSNGFHPEEKSGKEAMDPATKRNLIK